jgi:hypothetical protein
MKVVYIVVKHNEGYDINVAAYENLKTALARLEKEQHSVKGWSFSYWIDTVVLNEE